MHVETISARSAATEGTHVGRQSVFVFLIAAAVLFVVHGNRFVLTNDEGILIEPAQRMAEGARPYVDFFGYMSPGSYWIQAALFRVFGASFWVGRLPVIAGFSTQIALVFWLVARLASRRVAIAAVIVFSGFQVADPTFLTAQHRWDSATLALLGVSSAIGFAPRAAARRFSLGLAASGALLALAAWCTPSVGLAAVAVPAWLVISRERRRLLLPFIAGAAAVTLAAAGRLWTTGTIGAFVHQMLWLKQNYAAVNVMPYGSVIGGYGRLLEGSSGIEAAVGILLIFCLALPAILPPLAALLWGLLSFRRKAADNPGLATVPDEVLLLGLAGAALVASTFPRADLMHLAFVAAIPYVLTASALARLLSARAGAVVVSVMIPLALLFSWNEFTGAWAARPVATPVGTVRAAADVAPELQKLVTAVHPGDALFVYPYLPMYYFVTQAKNPTRFAFLAPGMMTTVEERAALAEISAHPPEWLMYMQLSREEYLRVFPNAAGLNQRFESIEAWIEANYRPVDSPRVNIGGYRLWKRTKVQAAVRQ